jgi:hypothetical protein
MKKSRIVLGLVTGLVVTGLIIIALLPAIVSSDMMIPLVIEQVNRQLPGRLQLESWSLSWFSGIEVKGLVYDNPSDGLLVQVSEIRAEKGIWGLMVAGGELGPVEIADPAMVYFLSEKSTSRGSQKTPSPARTADSLPAGKNGAVLPVYYGKFNITNGSIRTAAADGNETVVAKNLNLTLNAPGPDSKITYRFSIESGDSNGQASGEGSFTVAKDDFLNLKRIQSDSTLRIKNWELENIFAILATRAGIPSAKGHLNAHLSVTGSSAQNLKMAGQMTMETLRLRGGPLETDIPTVTDIAIDLDGRFTDHTLSLDKLTFRSSLASGSARGSADDENHKRLAGKADVDLAEVFAQFPATLKLREGTKMTNGKMAISANIETAGRGTAFNGDARIERLQGISAGKKISWTKPVTVTARGEIRREGLQLENLALRSSFLKADGRGNLGNIQVDLSADLKAALDEMKKFIQIKQWDGNGKLKLNFHSKETKERLNHATLTLRIDDFVLSRNRRPILDRQVVRADLISDVQVAQKIENSLLLQPSLKIQSSVASGTVTARQVAGSPSNSFSNATDLKLEGNIDLQQLSSLLKNLGLISTQTLLSGQSKIQTSGAVNDGLLAIDNARIDTQKLIYRQDNKIIRENRVILTTRGQIDLNNRSIELAPVDIDGKTGKIHIPELDIADWSDAQKNIKINGQADLDLNKLARGYGDFVQFPENTELSGNGCIDFDMDFTHPKTQYLKLQGHLAPFKLVSRTLPAVSEKKVTVNADITRSADGRNMTINNFDLNSNALSLSAAGTLNRVGKNKVLDARGTVTPDMKLVSEYLKKSGHSKVTFSGKKASPFTIKLVSNGDRWEDPLKHLNFSGAVYIGAVEAYGMKLSPNDVPVRVAGAAVGAKLESPANGGQLDFQPTVDMRKEPYILSFKENTDLLKDVQISQGLIDGFLAAIHPLFKDAVIPDGLLGLSMKHFSWPLSEKHRNRATFAGTLKLNGVKLNSTPFMADLLNMIGIRERQLSLVDQDIAFEARDGRIALSPMTLEAEGYLLTIQGSIGFDSTLDFIARIPVTEKIIGKDAYQFLQGTTIKVPISGTAAKPRIDQSAFQQASNDLMQQALRKNLEKGAQDLLKNLFKK